MVETFIESGSDLLAGLDAFAVNAKDDLLASGFISKHSQYFYKTDSALTDQGAELYASTKLEVHEELEVFKESAIDSELWGSPSVEDNDLAEELPTSFDEKPDPILGNNSQALLSPSLELSNIDSSTPEFIEFSLFDASGDSTLDTIFDDGALRLNYDLGDFSSSFSSVYLEAWQDDSLTSTLGTWSEVSLSDELLNLANFTSLTAGDYDFRLVARDVEGTNVAATSQSISILPWLSTLGTFEADTLTYDTFSPTGAVFLGRGGTDTLALNGLEMGDIANINGVSLTDFTVNNTRQAIFGGTAFDYMTLADGREIYFQGVEFLNFDDGSLDLLMQPSDTYFDWQWNLHVSDVSSAWRFTQGSEDVLLVSLDTGILTAPGTFDGVVDVDTGRLILDATDDDEFQNKGHGHQAISVMSSAANNDYGVSGINWHSSVYVHDVYNSDRTPLQQAIAETLDYARSNDLKVVFQGGIQGEFWLTDGGTQAQLEKLISENSDIAVFAIAAGNGNIDIDETSLANPSVRDGTSGGVARLQTDHSNVIAVGALENRDANGNWANTWQNGLMNAGNVRRASYSNYGESLTLMAATDSPAMDRYGNMNYFSGTSAANPNMAGIASLVWSVNESLEGGEVRQILIDTAMDLGTVGKDTDYGHGLVNADAAVRRAWALKESQDLAKLHTGNSILA